MYSGFIEKKPEIGQLLVRLYDNHKLYAISNGPSNNAREELIGIFADLLELQLKPSETEMITDVLIGIITQAEIDLRAALSERLAAQDDVPLRMVLHLANDEIDVALPLLEKSKILSDMDLVYIVKSKKADHARAIAKRPKMTEILINALVDTEDLLTAISLARNTNITITNYAIDKLTDMAKISNELAEPLIDRKDIPQEMIASLYHHVGQALKDSLDKKFGVQKTAAAKETIDDILFEMENGFYTDFLPDVAMMIRADSMMVKRLINPEVMIDNLRRGQTSFFVALFSVYCGLEAQTVVNILKQKSGQGLAIACRAVGMMKPEFINIFLLTHRIRTDGSKVIHKSELGSALKSFDRMTPDMAIQILNGKRH